MGRSSLLSDAAFGEGDGEMVDPSTWTIAVQSARDNGDTALRFFFALVITGEVTGLLLHRWARVAGASSTSVGPRVTGMGAATTFSSAGGACCCCESSCWESCCCPCCCRCSCCCRCCCCSCCRCCCSGCCSCCCCSCWSAEPCFALICGSSSSQKCFLFSSGSVF